MIRVAHVRDYIIDGKVVLVEHIVYVGRRNNRLGLPQSPLANPYTVSGGRTRDDAILAFRAWLHVPQVLDADGREGLTPESWVASVELARLRALHKKHGELVLLCWCHPKPCHASVIAEALEAE